MDKYGEGVADRKGAEGKGVGVTQNCSYCNKSFRTKSALYVHMRLHGSKKDLSKATYSSAVAVDPSTYSSAVAVDPSLLKYDVFISLSGETRNSFASHLYSELLKKQINAYIDEVSLEKGEDISHVLSKAIEESTISIIIFSENYVSSSLCLDELVHILKCREEKDQIVLPIFYNIDPSDIRKQETAFEKHEKLFKDRMEKVREWRQALKEAAAISGWDSRNMFESLIIEEVVERVRTELDSIKSKRSGDFKGLVGIQERLEKIKSFLGSPTVRIIGIWGMGGIGKTTLAKAVFNRFYNDFEGSYFAHRVRENAIVNKGLVKLEKKVYSKLLGEKNLNIFNSSDVNDRLSRKRILLVLDDVETPMQLRHLVGEPDRFCPGSKIIVTSRHKLLVDAEYNAEYKVGVLGLEDACKLFYLNAFPDKSCRRGYEVISHKVVEYANRHPLVLEVLGASVFCFLESIEEWEKELEELERIPNDEIQDVLKRSYNALDEEEKGLFLDIACFFKGQRSDFVEGVLEGKPITGLLNKSLITIEDGEIHMHDLIQEMGRDIVLRSTQKLGDRSRLWIAKDVADVLENNKGTKEIEGIYLPLTEDEVRLRPDVFEKMPNLRLLKFYYFWYGKVKFYDGDLEYLPNSLRYLHWEYYPGKSWPSNFKPQYLVELHMPCSELEQLWDGVQELGRLRHINLFKSRLLTKIPDLSRAPKLESINLSCCESLSHIPSLNLDLQATVDGSVYRHQWLSVEVDYFEFEAERTPGCIILNGCLGLKTLPEVCGSIRKLVLRRTPMEELPSSIESLESLLLLDSSYCYNLKSLPKLPRNIEVLVLNFSGMEQIPSSSIEGLCSLRILSTGYCEHLEFIPETLGKLTSLQRLSLSGCSRLVSLPILSGLCCLTELDLGFCNIREIPASIGMLYMLKRLSIERCKNLQSLPELPLFIESVNAQGCLSLEMVSTLGSTLTLGRWLDKYDSDNDRREFLFEDCRNLCEDAMNNIFREFLYKVFCTATTPPEVVRSVSKIVIGNLVVCYPTKEIPRWFNNRSEGSSITITLPPNWYNPKTFLGFVVSVIFSKVGDGFDPLKCELHLKTNCGESLEEVVFEYAALNGYSSLSSDNMVVWYKYFDHSKANFEKYQEASFEFKCHSKALKRCGVRMLYLKDAVEESDDGSTVNFESWRTDVIDYGDSYCRISSCRIS